MAFGCSPYGSRAPSLHLSVASGGAPCHTSHGCPDERSVDTHAHTVAGASRVSVPPARLVKAVPFVLILMDPNPRVPLRLERRVVVPGPFWHDGQQPVGRRAETPLLHQHESTLPSIHKNSMNTELPPVIAAFFEATNTREFADFLSLFTAEAHVNDEANDYYGAEIAAWIDRATADTKPTAEVTGITGDGERIVVTAGVSGNFPGSPVQLLYSFTLKDDKIAELFIKA